MNINFLQLIGIAILVCFVVFLIVGKRGHRLKMRMKQFGNGMIWIGSMILAMYTILFGMLLLPKIATFVQGVLSGQNFSPNTVLAINGIPFAFIVMLFVLVIWFLKKTYSCRPFRLSDKEKQFEVSEDTKVAQSLHLKKKKVEEKQDKKGNE